MGSSTKGCGFVIVTCSYQCGAELSRNQIHEHELDVCPRQPDEYTQIQLDPSDCIDFSGCVLPPLLSLSGATQHLFSGHILTPRYEADL